MRARAAARGTTLRDMPVVILTSRGASPGKIRKTPFMRVEHDGVYAVVASQGGAPTHPLWYFNLVPTPMSSYRTARSGRTGSAREVTGERGAPGGGRAVAAYPDYADYQAKHGTTDPGLRLGADRLKRHLGRRKGLPRC